MSAPWVTQAIRTLNHGNHVATFSNIIHALSAESIVAGASYIVWEDGGTYYAKNGLTGVVDYSGTDAVTVAQNALDQLTTGGKLHFKQGTYVFTNSLWNQSIDYIKISGEGYGTVIQPDTVRESTLTVQANAGTGALTVADGTQFQIDQQIVCGTKDYTTVDKDWRRITNIVGNVLTLDSVLTYTHLVGAPVWTAYRCIEATGAEGIIIENLRIDGNVANQYYYSQANAVIVGSTDKIFRVQNGIHLYQCGRSIIRNIYTDSAAGWGGVVMEDCDYGNIDSCVTDDGVDHGVIMFLSRHGSITNCKARSNGGATTGLGHGIAVEACYYCDVIGNTAELNYVDGFYIWGTGQSIAVVGNTAYNNRIGMNIGNVDYSSVIGNAIVTIGTVGVESIGIKAFNNVVISGNSILVFNKDEGNGYGILVNAGAEALLGVVVSDNTINRWTGGGYFDPYAAICMDGAGGTVGSVTGNVIYGTYDNSGICYAATATPYSNQKISDNVMYIDTTDYGINILSTGADTTNIISDNIITGTTTPINFATATNEPEWNTYEPKTEIFMDVLALTAAHVRSNEDLSAGLPLTFTLDAQPDVPRTLSGHFDAHANITAYSITITGINAEGIVTIETLTEADGWDWETENAFGTITTIIMTARTGTGAGDTMDIGITEVLGLSDPLYVTSDVYKIKKNNANATVAGAQVNVTYNTYDLSVITLAGGDDFTFWYKVNENIIS